MDEDPKKPSYDWGTDEGAAPPSPPGAPAGSAPGRPAGDPVERFNTLKAAFERSRTASEAGAAPESARVIQLPARMPEPEEPQSQAGREVEPPPAPSQAMEPEVQQSQPEMPQMFSRSESSAKPIVPAPVVGDTYKEEDFEKDDEPFDLPDVQKLGILGGKGVGKSYLFQAMVYRTYSGQQSGAMTYYLEEDGIHLFRALRRSDSARTLNRVKFIKQYASWQRLPPTNIDTQQWYRLRLRYRTGWLGRQRSAMDVEFFDGSGEGFFQREADTSERRKLWRDGYLKARTMVFCLPLWAAFPSSDLTDEDWSWRDLLLEGFEQVVQNYTDLRNRHKLTTPVSSILALTMADDRRSALQTLHDRWIEPYMVSPRTYLKQLHHGSGIARYLANARRVSEALHEEFAAARDPQVGSIPQSLDFHGGKPWIVPLSAIDGGRLEQIEQDHPDPDTRARFGAPVPVHVELPLLVALCERENALM